MNMKMHSSHDQHGFAHLTVRAQPRPIDFACASGPCVRQSRGCHRFCDRNRYKRNRNQTKRKLKLTS